MAKTRVNCFYRIVKAGFNHQFPGLYAVEKVFFEGDRLIKKEIIHEWDLRIIAESKLAQLGGASAYETYKMDHEINEAQAEHDAQEVSARTAEDLKLTQNKLTRELKLKPE